VKRTNRLTHTNDIQRVRRTGKSFAHPLVVLLKESSPDHVIRVGVIAGKSVGGAVERNHAKRWIRAAVEEIFQQITPGSNLIFIARKPITRANYCQVLEAVEKIAGQAGILLKKNV
jgi:ribonuclease P protein component